MVGLGKQTVWPSFHGDHECSSWHDMILHHVYLIFQKQLKMISTLANFFPFDYY